MSVQTPGEAAYEAYADERAKTDPRPVDWKELGTVRQGAWEAAAQAVLKTADPRASVGSFEALRLAAQELLNPGIRVHLLLFDAVDVLSALETLHALKLHLKEHSWSAEAVDVERVCMVLSRGLKNPELEVKL